MALFHFQEKKNLCDSAFIPVKHNSALCRLGQYEQAAESNMQEKYRE